MSNIIDSVNNNNVSTSQDIYNSYNNFIFSNDIKIFGKLMLRNSFFEKIKNIPGDIVEVGVFKGSGVTSWLKMIKLHCGQSNKKVVGFDFFNSMDTEQYCKTQVSGMYLNAVINRTSISTLELDVVKNTILNSDIDPTKLLLIKGDITSTTKIFFQENPGFRISLLYIDVDLGEATYYSLLNLWDRILPGGIIIFDEYEFHKFTESCGVEKFLKEKNIAFTLESTNFISPSAFMIKKTF